jgi:hypothetical protein
MDKLFCSSIQAKANTDVVLAALRQNLNSITHVSNELLSDGRFLLNTMTFFPAVLKYGCIELELNTRHQESDREIVLKSAKSKDTVQQIYFS